MPRTSVDTPSAALNSIDFSTKLHDVTLDHAQVLVFPLWPPLCTDECQNDELSSHVYIPPSMPAYVWKLCVCVYIYIHIIYTHLHIFVYIHIHVN